MQYNIGHYKKITKVGEVMSEEFDRYRKEEKLKKFLMGLPIFVEEYFMGIQLMSINTQLSYCYNIRTYLRYLSKEIKVDVKNLTIEQFGQVTSTEFEKYINYLRSYVSENGKLYHNSEKGLKRATDCLNSCYEYFIKKRVLTDNPIRYINRPHKLHKKTAIYLNNNEMNQLLRSIKETPEGDISKWKVANHNINKYRDYAIITILIGTGMRVSELCGLDIDDINFDERILYIIRKGGDEDTIHLSYNVFAALVDYLELDRIKRPVPDSERALFLSKLKKRLSVRSIQRIVRENADPLFEDKFKYSKKHISPHKLRSSYATALYEETGDIYIVAEMLGHKNIGTTRDHYIFTGNRKKRETALLFDNIIEKY